MIYEQFPGFIMTAISTVCWFCVTGASRIADNPSWEPHVRQTARGNRAGYKIAAWFFTAFAAFHTLLGFAMLRQ